VGEGSGGLKSGGSYRATSPGDQHRHIPELLSVPFPRGLYALTPDEPDTSRLVRQVRAALAGGAAAVQYRSKAAPGALRRAQAAAVLACCRAAGVPLIVNDDLALAEAVGADGVHLGRDDGDLGAARRRLGPGRLLGASCYNRLELAREACAAGADYVAFGAAFASPTKPAAVRAPLELYRDARRVLDVPIVAIGGITVENAPALVAAGVDALAVISALFDAVDVEGRARGFHRLFVPTEHP
jgi:thiamine-phosphate pyrophosphorylase